MASNIYLDLVINNNLSNSRQSLYIFILNDYCMLILYIASKEIQLILIRS